MASEANLGEQDRMGDSDGLLQQLTRWQHVRPHDSLRQILLLVGENLALCPDAFKQALRRLQIDVSRPVGRLRRAELIQLSRSLHDHWRQNVPQDALHAR